MVHTATMARSHAKPARDERQSVNTHFQTTAAYWKQVYEGHGLSATIYQQRRDKVLQMVDRLALPPDSQALEVGCGAGVTSVALAQRGFHVEAVDSVAAMIDLTRLAAHHAGVGARVKPGICDVNTLSFPDNAFDLLLAIGVIPWVQSPETVLEQMARVVKPGGYLIVSSENVWQLHHVLDPLLNPLLAGLRPRVGDFLRRLGLRGPLAAPRHRPCSNRAFDRMLAALNLQKLDGLTVGFGPFSLAFCKVLPESTGVAVHRKLQSWADRRLPVLRSAGSNYIVLARKLAE